MNPHTHSKSFRILASSSNTNSFGLKQHVLLSNDGTAFKVCRSPYSGDPWSTNQDVQVPTTSSGTPLWSHLSVELPEQLPSAPKNIIEQIFK